MIKEHNIKIPEETPKQEIPNLETTLETNKCECEPFVDLGNGGKYDEGEDFTDALNGKYDIGEKFIDVLNGEYDIGESFVDKLNGIYDKGEEFIDVGNKRWDVAEIYIDKNDNYRIISPVDDNYSENRFLLFKFNPGNPGSITNDEVSWEKKPKWKFPR